MTAPVGTQFERHTDSFMDWVRANGKAVGIAAIAAAAIATSVVIYNKTQATKGARADQALAAAQGTYASGNLPLAKSDLEKLASRYSGTEAATEAKVMLAQIAYDQGKPAEGLKALEGVSTSGALGATVLTIRGAGYEQSRQFEQAAKAYLEAADRSPIEAEKRRHRAEAARAYAAGGKKEEAAKIWRELLATGDPYYAQEAELRLGELTAQPAKRG